MDYKGHLILGAIVSIIFISIMKYFFNWFPLNISSVIIIAIIITIYCLLPDSDTKASKIVWFFIGVAVIGLIIGAIDYWLFNIPSINGKALILFSIILIGYAYISAEFIPHRGIIHTVWIGLILSGLLYFVLNDWQYVCLGFVAYLSHLWGDGYVFKLW